MNEPGVSVLPAPPISERAARLHHSPLFSTLAASDVRALAEGCETLGVLTDTTILRQGDPADAFYIVVDGLLRVRRRDASGNEEIVGHLYKGEFFGEVALVEATARSATVEAENDAVLMRLSRAAFEQALITHPAVRDAVVRQLDHRRGLYQNRPRPDQATLQGALSTLLGGVDLSGIPALKGEIDAEWVEAGTVLISEGEAGDCMYFVLSGRMQVYRRRPDGSEFYLDELGVGAGFGEAALMDHTTRNACVRAIEDTEVLRLGRRGLDALFARHPKLWRHVRDLAAEHAANRTDKTSISRLQEGNWPTPRELRAVLDTSDPVTRNLRITWMYHRLSLALQRLLGDRDASWACFGCRASYTAGYSIRKDDDLLPPAVQRLQRVPALGRAVDAGISVGGRIADATPLGREVTAALDTVSRCISAGNIRIFAEIGTVMDRFVIAFAEDTRRDPDKLEGFLRTLPPGPPELGGQDVLRQGMRAWYEARYAATPKARSEWILLGNMYIGVHEQTRVQADLIEALEAPLRMHLGDEVGDFLFGRAPLRWLPSRLRRWLHRGVDRLEAAWVRLLGDTLRNQVTRRMMRIRLSTTDVWLGAGISAADAEPYPADLTDIALPELRELLDRFGAGGDRPPDDGASDWGTFPDRMRFIIRLFRARQHDPRLFDPPFQSPPP